MLNYSQEQLAVFKVKNKTQNVKRQSFDCLFYFLIYDVGIGKINCKNFFVLLKQPSFLVHNIVDYMTKNINLQYFPHINNKGFCFQRNTKVSKMKSYKVFYKRLYKTNFKTILLQM